MCICDFRLALMRATTYHLPTTRVVEGNTGKRTTKIIVTRFKWDFLRKFYLLSKSSGSCMGVCMCVLCNVINHIIFSSLSLFPRGIYCIIIVVK